MNLTELDSLIEELVRGRPAPTLTSPEPKHIVRLRLERDLRVYVESGGVIEVVPLRRTVAKKRQWAAPKTKKAPRTLAERRLAKQIKWAREVAARYDWSEV